MTPTRLNETLSINFTASYLWHIKHSLKSTYTENTLFTTWKTQNSEFSFMDRTIKGITKALFFCDTTTQLPILTKYPHTIEFDTTFNTISVESVDCDMFPQGNFTLQDCNNNSYITASVIYMANEKCKEDFKWIFQTFKNLLVNNGIPFPHSFGVDR